MTAFGLGNQVAKGADHGKNRLFKQQFTAALNEAAGDITKLRAVVNTTIAAAIAGDMQAVAMIMDRVDGKVPQAHTGPDEGPIKHELIQRLIVDPRSDNPDSTDIQPPPPPLPL